MRSTPSLLLLTWLLCCPSLLAQGRGPGSRKVEPVELAHFSYAVVSFDAPSLRTGKGELGVYLPKGYEDSGERVYPWILWLHGMNEDASRFHDGGGAAALDAMAAKGLLPEVVLVAPSGPRRTIYANGEGAGAVEDYILKDVIGYVQGHYRVATERAGRVLMGVSMGGMAALRIALKDPNAFCAVAAHSAAAFPPDPSVLDERSADRVRRSVQSLGLGAVLGDPIDPEKWGSLIPSAMVKGVTAEGLDGLRVFFDAGTEDRYGFGPPNEEFHQLLDQQQIVHTFHMVDGGGHSWGSGSMQERLSASLGFVADALTPKVADQEPAPAPAAGGTDEHR